MKKQDTLNTEQLILLAAEREFFSKGYDGARTTTIAEAAGVTHAMLHYYFRTKENLFECILNQKMHLAILSITAVFGSPKLPIIERIKNSIAVHFDFLAANPELPKFIINEIFPRPEFSRIMKDKITTVLSEIYPKLQQEINEAVERGEIENIDITMLLISIMSLNMFSFIAYPFMELVLGTLTSDREKFLEQRKTENIETIMRRIQKRPELS